MTDYITLEGAMVWEVYPYESTLLADVYTESVDGTVVELDDTAEPLESKINNAVEKYLEKRRKHIIISAAMVPV